MQEKLLKFINDKLDTLISNNPQVNDFKRQAKVLHKKLKEEYQSKNKIVFIPLRQCQDLVAQQHGYKHWHEFHTMIKKLYQNKQESLSIKYAHNKPLQFDSNLEPIHIGYNSELGMQSWLDQDSLKKHVFLEGSAERSNLELRLIEATIKNGDHIIYMGSSSSDINNIKELAIKAGREKDIRTISFMTNYMKTEKTNWYFPKNLPYSSVGITELILSLIDDHTMNNRMWKGYAISLVSSVMMALVYLREKGEIVLSFDTMVEYFSLKKVEQLYSRKDLPLHINKALHTYLLSLPNYQFLEAQQNNTVIEHNGYMYMVIAQILGRLNDNFKYLMKGGENQEQSQNKFNELYGGQESLIFLITYPNYNTSTEELFSICYMVVNMIKNGILNKLGRSLSGNVIEEIKPVKTTWVIKDCPLPRGFAIIPSQAIAVKLQLILSYKNLLDYTSEEERKSIAYSSNIKCSNFKLIDNKMHYKIVVDNQEENLLL